MRTSTLTGVALLIGACGGPAGGPGARAKGGADTAGSEGGADGAADGAGDGAGDGAADGGDGGAPDSGADTGADTGAPPCAEGLQVDVAGVEVPSGGALELGHPPAWGDPVGLRLRLHNPCADDLRFLGHPDDWIDGPAFGLTALPPIALAPGEGAELELTFTPGDEGDYAGTFELPHDQPGSPLRLELRAQAGAPLTLVLVGEGRRVTTSHDYGATWSTDAWETLEAHTNALQRGLCAGPAGFVAVGGSDTASWWTSPDGDAWTAHTGGAGWLADCACGAGGCATYGGQLWTSADGAAWSPVSSPYAPLHIRAMAAGRDPAGAEVFVAVGDGGRVARSRGGAAFDVDLQAGAAGLGAVAFGDPAGQPVFVAVGADGEVVTSADGGATWARQALPGAGDLAGVVYGRVGGQGRFLAGDGAAIYQSADGYAWSTVNASPVVPLAQVGTLWFGAVGSAVHRSADGGFSWTLVHPADGGPSFLAARLAEVPE